jgi:hypothetical protein
MFQTTIICIHSYHIHGEQVSSVSLNVDMYIGTLKNNQNYNVTMPNKNVLHGTSSKRPPGHNTCMNLHESTSPSHEASSNCLKNIAPGNTILLHMKYAHLPHSNLSAPYRPSSLQTVPENSRSSEDRAFKLLAPSIL